MIRTILHVDLDAFFCSVEELEQPELKGCAFAVGGKPDKRGVVSSASYPARRYGIKSAMPTARALRLCPDLIIVSPHHKIYSKYSRKVMGLLSDSAPLVEQLSIDEAFLDVSDDPLPGKGIAASLQKTIKDRFGLPTSWGVATNKLVAKIASEVGKPEGLVVVPPGEEERFLSPLPVQMLWGVGPKTCERLDKLKIRSIGELAIVSPERLMLLFGERGLDLIAKAKGVDRSAVASVRERRSISSERTFAADVAEYRVLDRSLRRMSEELGSRLRKEGLAGATVRIKVRWPDFSTITRQARLQQPSDQEGEIYRAASKLFRKAWHEGAAVRLLGVGVSNLGPPARQLELFNHSWEHDENLLKAIDSIRKRYGPDALRRADSLRGENRRRDSD
jgi:DNA polymerase-4